MKKTGEHPHTNMAKASLNMLTRTIAGEMLLKGIIVNAVDTGWVTSMLPVNNPRAIFIPPLSEQDGMVYLTILKAALAYKFAHF